ncbi:family 43 glycosylhydrolase [Mucilaginibacter pedocola]|uniref:Beta-xylosidase n=1 Tax=Mucilaginibacter pedocola TaxID=1792845 RepID=A0A1S9PG71_9SPHI|nr:family 43 glycosylhydrolase [Mucilaginibacter pedocola]OOQ59887.1 beta-xylosidase [Mucilaginibacter pedocola]
MKKKIFLYSFVALFITIKAHAQEHYSAYLFTYFTSGKGGEHIRFALSKDGYHFRALNKNQSVINSKDISATGGVRDPHILRGADGKTFYMVATDMNTEKYQWGPDSGMVLMRSADLVHWTSKVVNVPLAFKKFAGVNRVWAPQTIYDEQAGKYMLYWSMRFGNEADKIYYAYANKDFTGLETEPKQLFFKPDGGACIDGDIVHKDKKYYLFFKTEGSGAGIKIAVSDKLTSGYVLRDTYVQQTKDPVEGAGTFKLNNTNSYVLMYDMYTQGKYQFTRTNDLQHFTRIDDQVSMNFHPRHGTVIPITAKEAARLSAEWETPEDVLLSAGNKQIKSINITFNDAEKKLYLPVVPGTDLRSFDPAFVLFPGVTVSPSKPQNFSNGPVKYTVTIAGKKPDVFNVTAQETHNPALTGYYADPEVLYAEKTGKFYIYPTSDGFDGWSGNYFKTFSSPDLVNWKDEGKILDLPADVSWANRNAWAPCIIEKKMDGKYQYFYYFTGAQKIGVAVADDPAGPFKDSGKPLLAQLPEGVKGGQQIDPDVFADPISGKTYLYWGNSYMAVAELSADMLSIVPGTTKILTPTKTYNEGTYVFYRKGTYYFMWSENDTRDPNYTVRYGTSKSPTGPIEVSEHNTVIAKDEKAGIYGTGHNSVIQVPGTDDWFIVYHRFNYPKGITMGDAAGYNREVCIDKLDFNTDGTIKQVTPTHAGIKPVLLRSNK